jgi:asparagine synthase (glutamine-hydrolysing)
MCGIAGIIGLISDRNQQALGKMSRALSHRGPDGEGQWIAPPDSNGWGPMLAHRRLSILDVSTAAAQPMIDTQTGNVVVLNGEIYNYIELREKIQLLGHKFNSTGDTEVMLRAMSLDGCDALLKFRGMFAFAFWDFKKRELLLTRDPLGIKPLYIARNPDPDGHWSLIFASEVRAILAAGLMGRSQLNPIAPAMVCWNGFMVAPETAVAGIEAVMPGQMFVFDGKGIELKREFYWRAIKNIKKESIELNELTNVMEECIRLHLASDVPLAVFLSGGVDSTSIANLAQKATREPINTFTLAFEEQQYNEGNIARQIAAAIGTRHHEVVLTEGRFVGQLNAALNSLDQPSFDGINSYFISQAVRSAGFKVALAGTGGDELFGGYQSFRQLPKLMKLLQLVAWVPERLRVGLAKSISSAIQPSNSCVPPQTGWAKLPQVAQCGSNLLSLYQLAYEQFLPSFTSQLLADQLNEELSEGFVDGLPLTLRLHLLNESESRSSLSAISVMEQRLFLGERLLRDTDTASMAASIEVRLPLVDQVFFESVDSLPDNQRYLPIGKKAALRCVGLRGLDPAIFDRKKSGFVMPFDRWIRSGLGKVMEQMMLDPVLVRPTGLNPTTVRRLWLAFLEGAPGIYWTRVWALYVFIRWCHHNKVYR